MQQRRATNLLAAAGTLSELGRKASADSLLDGLAAHHAADLQDAAENAARQGRCALAGLGAAALMRVLPAQHGRTAAMAIWNAVLSTRTNHQACFDAALLRLYIASIEPIPRAIGRQDQGPDLAYVLAMSLPQDRTGYSMRTQSLVKALAAQGRSVVCLTRPGFPWTRGVSEADRTDMVEGILYRRTGTPTDRAPQTLGEVLALETTMIQELGKLRPRRVMAASDYATAIPVLLAAQRLGLPFLYEARGFWEISRAAREPGFRDSEAFATAQALEGAVAAKADLVLTLNGPMRDELIARGVAAERIALLPNAADPDALFPIPRDVALASRLGLTDAVPVIGYVGSFSDYEGLEDLILAGAELMKRGQDFRLLLVGWDSRGENRIGPALRALAEKLGLSERLIMPGAVDQNEVAKWYSLIDIAPVPRRPYQVTRLVSPLKPREAMAMGKAVVLSDLPPMAEMVRPGETGCLFPSGDHMALAQVLSELVADPARRKALGCAAREAIVKEHSWERRATACWEAIACLSG